MRIGFKKVAPELQPSDSMFFFPLLRSAGSIACFEAGGSYEGHGRTPVSEDKRVCWSCWWREDLSESSKNSMLEVESLEKKRLLSSLVSAYS